MERAIQHMNIVQALFVAYTQSFLYYSQLSISIYTFINLVYTNITEVDLSAFVYRLFQEDFSSVLGANVVGFQLYQFFICNNLVGIKHPTTCDSRTNLNHILGIYHTNLSTGTHIILQHFAMFKRKLR